MNALSIPGFEHTPAASRRQSAQRPCLFAHERECYNHTYE